MSNPPPARHVTFDACVGSLDAKTSRRLSTQIRIRNLHILITELALGGLLIEDTANLLYVSISGARKYMRELQEARVIYTMAVKGKYCAANRLVAHLTSDRRLVMDFLDKLGPRPDQHLFEHDPATQQERRAIHPLSANQYNIAKNSTATPIQRDPLVTALFGQAKK